MRKVINPDASTPDYAVDPVSMLVGKIQAGISPAYLRYLTLEPPAFAAVLGNDNSACIIAVDSSDGVW